MPAYRNPPTVVVVLIPVEGLGGTRGLLMVRRGIPPGVGELALPGGYQVEGETWQDAAAREVEEETGIQVSGFHLLDLVTVDGGRRNLAFAQATPIKIAPNHVFKPDHETQEIMIVKEPVKTCFETHTHHVKAYFEREWLAWTP